MRSRLRSSLPLFGVFLAVLATPAPQAVGQTVATWTGLGADANWSTTLNWSGSAPANSTTRALVFEGATALSNTNTLTSATASSITFNSAGFTLDGNVLTLATTGTISSPVVGTNTLPLPLSMAGGNSRRGIRGIGGANLVINGDISNATSAGWVISKSGTAGTFTVTFGGSTSFGPTAVTQIDGSGGLTSQGVTVNYTSTNAFGSGTLSFGVTGQRMTRMRFDNLTGGPATTAMSITVNNSAASGFSVSDTLTFVGTDSLTTTGRLYFPQGRSFTVQQNTLSVGGLQTDNGNSVLAKWGAGTLRLTGSVTGGGGPSFTGTTATGGVQVNAGKLAIANPLALGRSGTLRFNEADNSTGTTELIVETDLTGTNALLVPVLLGDAGNDTGNTIISGSFGLTLTGMLRNVSANRTLQNSLTSGTLRLDGPVYLASATANHVTLGGAGTTVIGGTITQLSPGIGSLTKTGAGLLQIAGLASYSGTTTVSGGALLLSTTAAITGTAARPY
jgi:fibronectin-binding autotransporter adhesin